MNNLDTKTKNTVTEIAEAVNKVGGNAYLVGGCVRDGILGLESKDADLEVYGLDKNSLEQVLSQFGEVNKVGASFQVYKVNNSIDVSLPRRERKVGHGHKGFDTEYDKDMSRYEACLRRDFTINAILQDPLTGGIEDPMGGVYDLDRGVLRVCNEKAFTEDSLRVLRALRFSMRFGVKPDIKTSELAKSVSLNDLPKERIWGEIEKILLTNNSDRNLMGLAYDLGLDNSVFRRLFDIKEKERNLYCVYLDRAFVYHYNCKTTELDMKLYALLGGKDPSVLEDIGCPTSIIRRIEKVSEALTDVYKKFLVFDATEFRRVSSKIPPKYLVAFSWIFLRGDYIETRVMAKQMGEDNLYKPLLSGRHLIEMGLEPNPDFTRILNTVFESQIRGELMTLEECKNYAQELI